MRPLTDCGGGSEEKEDWALCADGSWWVLRNDSWVRAEPEVRKILDESMVVGQDVREREVVPPNHAYPRSPRIDARL
jgi:hypothetical protein